MIESNAEMDVKLSICITTRNRSDFLRQTLESIIPQVTNEVEIVIVDGASTDQTGSVAKEFQQKYRYVRYFRKETNSGVDRDYNSSIEAARGEYCWFMSDDDLMKPGAVCAVLTETTKKYSLLVVNAEDWDAVFSKRIRERRLPFSKDRVYAPSEGEQFFIDTAHHLSFIPALVIRRDLWLSREREIYFGSWFAHVGVVFQAPLPGNALLMANPIVAIRNENISWKSRIFEIWMIRWPSLVWSFNNFSDSSKKRICPKDPAKNWRALLDYRASGAYSYEEYKKFILPETHGVRFRILPALVSITPVPIINALSHMYHRIRPHQPQNPAQ